MKKLICLLMVCVLSVTCLASCVDVSGMIDGFVNKEGTDNSSAEKESGKDELSVEYVYSLAVAKGYSGTLDEFIAEFKGEAGKDGVGIASATFDEDVHLIITLTNGATIDCGKISVNVALSSAITIGANGNWHINGVDTGKKAEAKDSTEWHTGAGAPSYTLGKDGDLYLNTNNNDVYKKTSGVWNLLVNISGKDVTINEGDRYDITVNPEASNAVAAASKALLSAVHVEARFSTGVLTAQVSTGAGVIYKLNKNAGDAYVITNYHVVYEADTNGVGRISSDINLYLYGMEYTDYAIKAEYLGGSMNYDIAVLKVTDSAILRTTPVEAVTLADSSEVNILDTAIAVGCPATASISVTMGSVNVLSEYITLLGADNSTEVEFRVMRIDTPVNSGNSGGGLFNDKGELIGIVNAKEAATAIDNIGYAIPSNLAVAVAENVIRNCDGRTNVSVIKCVLGITISIGEINREYDPETGLIKVYETCIVNDILTGSIAENALFKNDVLVSFEIDGVEYKINHIWDGSEALLYASPTSTIYVNLVRGGVAQKARLYTNSSNFGQIK